VQTEGISVNLQIFPGAYSQKVSILLCVLAVSCKMHIKSQKNPKNAKRIFLYSV
jgi:hypothetical protein